MAKATLLIVCLFTIVSSWALDINQFESCVIRPDQAWAAFPSIFLDSTGSFLWPSGSIYDQNRTISVPLGATLQLSCVGTTFEIFPLAEFATAECLGGDEFEAKTSNDDPVIVPFDKLGCVTQPVDDATDQGNLCGRLNEGLAIDIGFAMENSFATLIQACLDVEASRSIFAHHVLYPEIRGRSNVSGNERPYYFQPDEYYGYEINEYYTQIKQKETVASLLGSQALADQYIRPDEYFYFSRGHLAPNADFIYFSHQDASFYFMNVAPQWQVFNGGNWYYLESAVRDFVEAKDKPLHLYTGTNGVCQLEDVNGSKVEIWLYPEENKIPVPQYYWKVLHDPETKTGVAFIGINNPYLTEEEIEVLKPCPTIDNHPVLDGIFHPESIEKGVLFVCQVNDIDQIFQEIPVLGDLELLI
ncbi:hypothetical protein TCAL_15017 [Tigriopus californicus]|uniref:DNA/RNA non-specific endonuclease domain-containing protein n=1 Tax=Tigriopus californicus TaxID=6832 RepID=A0A553NX79_TIGCA|nr:hypothetical protein TCAL_15017 [Tigriopus californicus]